MGIFTVFFNFLLPTYKISLIFLISTDTSIDGLVLSAYTILLSNTTSAWSTPCRAAWPVSLMHLHWDWGRWVDSSFCLSDSPDCNRTLFDWLGSWKLTHLVLMYKTNTNKKWCTDVALTNPQQQEKEVASTNERRKINTKRGEVKKQRILRRLYFKSFISVSTTWPKSQYF